MPKGEKYFPNTVPFNTGLSSQSHCSHFQTKTGHFLHCRCMHIHWYIIIFFATWMFNFSVLSQLSLIHWLSSSLLLYEWYFFSIFLYKITLFTPHTLQYWIYSTGIYMNFTEWVMQHISKTILKENNEVVNLILPKPSNNCCTLRNLVKTAHFKGSQIQL